MKTISFLFLLLTLTFVIKLQGQSRSDRHESLNKLNTCVLNSADCEDIDEAVKNLIKLFEKGDKELARPLIEASLPRIVSIELLDFYWELYRDNTETFLFAISDKQPNVQRQYLEIASFFETKRGTELIKKKLLMIVKEVPELSQVANLGLQEIGRTSKPYYFSGFEYPVVYGKKGDGFPDEINIEGTVVEVSMSWGRCGTLAYAGTMKIKTTKEIDGYNDKYVYVLITCFSDDDGESKFLDKCVRFKAHKFYEKDHQFTAGLSNSSDSKGVPFYQIGLFGENSLYDKIKCN